jgi:hypothetical protein
MHNFLQFDLKKNSHDRFSFSKKIGENFVPRMERVIIDADIITFARLDF